MTAIEPATVFVVDDDESMRTSLVRLLGSAGWHAEPCATADEFLGRGKLPEMGCALLDVQMPGMTGPEAHQQMAARGIDMPVVFLTGYGDVATGVAAMKRGAVDFLEKPVDCDMLLEVVRKAMERQAASLGRDRERRDVLERVATLSPREREVMNRLLSGRLNKQIAGDMGIATKTVKVHRSRVMQKMRVTFVAQLVHLCEAAGIGPCGSH